MSERTRVLTTSAAAHICQSDPCSVCSRFTAAPPWLTTQTAPDVPITTTLSDSSDPCPHCNGTGTRTRA